MQKEPVQIRRMNNSQNLLFRWVANFFVWISKTTGRTYNEINVVMYFGFVPMSYMILLDCLYGWLYFSTGYLSFVLGISVAIENLNSFSNRIFRRSVDFLLLFNRIGSNYEVSSVIICVLLPIIIYAVLFYLLFQG